MSELRERILATTDLAAEKLYIDAWGVEVEVRGLTGRARAALLQQALEGANIDLSRVYPLLVIGCTYDPTTGERIFSEGDTELVAEKSGAVLEQIALTAARLSGLDAAAVESSKSPSGE